MKHQILIFTLLLSGCGGGGDTPSTGLKIFTTAEFHAGDFAGDPTLLGATAMQKADSFCNKSRSKPSDDNYKALLVDGVARDAQSLSDWVLKPNTDYYQSFNDVLIDKTTDAAIFAAYFRAMKNSVDRCGANCNIPGVWTGINDASTFARGSTCNEWGQAAVTELSGSFASSIEKDWRAFSSNGSTVACAEQLAIYCVQQ